MFVNNRFHYMDIRDYIGHYVSNYFHEIKDIAFWFEKQQFIDLDALTQIIDILSMIKQNIQLFIDAESLDLKSKSAIIQPLPSAPDINIIAYLINKIKNSYQHDNIKKIISDLWSRTITKRSNNIINKIDNIIKKFTNYKNTLIETTGKIGKIVLNSDYPWSIYYGLDIYTLKKYIFDISSTIISLEMEYVAGIYSPVMDLYFLRRFLDKNYITHAITLTGSAHSVSYIYILIKYFDFKITHASYASITNLSKLNERVKMTDLDKISYELMAIFERSNPVQCSDMTDFPENFM